MQVEFLNKTNQKVSLCWLDDDGSEEKITTIIPNDRKMLDTWETHPFFAVAKKGPDKMLIDGNFVFIPQTFPGRNGVIRADITNVPRDSTALRSSQSGFPVTVKFSNRTDVHVTVKWINANGQSQNVKDIAPKKAWLNTSCEGHYFKACEQGSSNREMNLNNGWFYFVKQPVKPQSTTKVLITEAGRSASGKS